MIVQNVSSEGRTDISFTVPTEDAEPGRSRSCEGGVLTALGAVGRDVDRRDIGKVSVVGAGMKSNPGVAATMFETLAANGINIEMISTSAIRISPAWSRPIRTEEAVQHLHTSLAGSMV